MRDDTSPARFTHVRRTLAALAALLAMTFGGAVAADAATSSKVYHYGTTSLKVVVYRMDGSIHSLAVQRSLSSTRKVCPPRGYRLIWSLGAPTSTNTVLYPYDQCVYTSQARVYYVRIRA